jgi:hypothetical protein
MTVLFETSGELHGPLNSQLRSSAAAFSFRLVCASAQNESLRLHNQASLSCSNRNGRFHPGGES